MVIVRRGNSRHVTQHGNDYVNRVQVPSRTTVKMDDIIITLRFDVSIPELETILKASKVANLTLVDYLKETITREATLITSDDELYITARRVFNIILDNNEKNKRKEEIT